MATGIVGTLAASSSLTYTPATNAKVKIAAIATAASVGVKVNSTYAVYFGAAGTAIADVYVGANATVTIATDATTAAVISTLEAG